MASADSEPGWGEEGPRGSTAGLRQCRHVERRHPAALGEDLGIRPGSPCGPGETPEPPVPVRFGLVTPLPSSCLHSAPHLSSWLSFSSLFVGLSVDSGWTLCGELVVTSPSGGCPSSVCVFHICGTFLYGTEALPFLCFIGFYKSHFIFMPANLPGLDCMW